MSKEITTFTFWKDMRKTVKTIFLLTPSSESTTYISIYLYLSIYLSIYLSSTAITQQSPSHSRSTCTDGSQNSRGLINSFKVPKLGLLKNKKWIYKC